MTDTLRALIQDYDNKKYATDNGAEMHKKMQFSCLEECRYDEIVQNIKSRPELVMFFDRPAKIEIPVAATINGNFISRRIDRMVVDNERRVIYILDYKTDIDKGVFYVKYVAQVREYMEIIRKIYPKYNVYGYILWLHDWTLEKL